MNCICLPASPARRCSRPSGEGRRAPALWEPPCQCHTHTPKNRSPANIGPQVQSDLVKDGGHQYFVKHLESRDPAVSPESRAQAAFVLAAICNGHSKGQLLCAQAGLCQVCGCRPVCVGGWVFGCLGGWGVVPQEPRSSFFGGIRALVHMQPFWLGSRAGAATIVASARNRSHMRSAAEPP